MKHIVWPIDRFFCRCDLQSANLYPLIDIDENSFEYNILQIQLTP